MVDVVRGSMTSRIVRGNSLRFLVVFGSFSLAAACDGTRAGSDANTAGTGGSTNLAGAAGTRMDGGAGSATAGDGSGGRAGASGGASGGTAGSGGAPDSTAGKGMGGASVGGGSSGGEDAGGAAGEGGAGGDGDEGGAGGDGGDEPSTCVVSVSSGSSTTCALRTDKSLFCWGTNTYGQLGVGSPFTTSQLRPLNVAALGAHVTQVSVAGGFFVCARTDDGKTWCWGSNSYGQLGFGQPGAADARSPGLVEGLGTNVAFVTAGNTSTCARTEDSEALCWGLGPLGTVQAAATATPVLVTTLASTVRQIGVGAVHACAIDANGDVWCWGTNSRGQLGTGGNSDSATPVAVIGISDVLQIAVGWVHTCALKSDRSLWCWGSAQYGQLGEGSSGLSVYRDEPQPVTALGNTVVQVSTHGQHTCALDTDASVWCWGANDHGELGDGTTEDRATPVRVTTLSAGATELAAGYDHTCAVLDGGSLSCWGYNYAGQLGDGTTTTRLRPVNVGLPCP